MQAQLTGHEQTVLIKIIELLGLGWESEFREIGYDEVKEALEGYSEEDIKKICVSLEGKKYVMNDTSDVKLINSKKKRYYDLIRK